eukprot:CAMPEP_0198222190 /NCGR_PEP_ID=MMETSP1445-20131203/86989_1 /TAXON_ID=36898 /ORGANISM="Pyramimonas sp., Strain CCMP2087" /LENGTH=287 /DNA_ID=CAMNT_0043900609 /DNA_START=36 /DNA_END=899 /DNA_ORIENTATION=-
MAASRWSARFLQTGFRIPGAKMRECILENAINANSLHLPFGFAQRASVTTLCAASLVPPWRIQPGSLAIHLPVSALPALQGAATTDNFIPRVSHRGAKTEANKVRKGQIIEIKGRRLEVTSATHNQGRARASGNVQLECRDLMLGTKTSERLTPDETVSVLYVDKKEFNFLYKDGATVHLMQPETFEQLEMSVEKLADVEKWLTESIPVTIAYIEDTVVSITVPDQVEVEVAEADPKMKTATADGRGVKNATLVNGIRIQVPGFIEAGDIVVVDTGNSSFVKRAVKN